MLFPVETPAYTIIVLLGAYVSSTRCDPVGSGAAFSHVTPPSSEYWARPSSPPATALPALVGSNSTSNVRAVVRCVQDTPASTLRQIPEFVAATSTWLDPGWNARRLT